MRDYELTVVVRPDIDDNQTKAANTRIQGLITQRGGEITNIQEWGKRRLAYHIQHHAEGTYFVYRAQMEPASAAEIEHELNLDEQVLRFITVHLEPKELEALKNPPAPMAPRPERRPMAPPPAAAAEAPAGAEAPAAGEAAAGAEAPGAGEAAAAAEAPAAEAEAPAAEASAAAAEVSPPTEPLATAETAAETPAAEAPEGAAEGGAGEAPAAE
jgi:small subunit ribosomal protein S6